MLTKKPYYIEDNTHGVFYIKTRREPLNKRTVAEVYDIDAAEMLLALLNADPTKHYKVE